MKNKNNTLQFFKTEKEQQIDTDFLLSADYHTGSTMALFPAVRLVNGRYMPVDQTGGFFLKNNNNFYPDSNQTKIFNHFERSLDLFKSWRKGERLVFIVDGDAIDGDHHGTHQLITHIRDEQKQIHVDMMNYFKKRIAFKDGKDKLYYLEGTESHTLEDEVKIAQSLNAEFYSINEQLSPFIEMYINGTLIWIYHHGMKAGRLPSKGNALRNELKRIYLECLEAGKKCPDVVITAHTHDPDYQTYMSNWKEVHGIILPSQQMKTRYVNGVAPTSVNRIGLQFMHVSKNGNIEIPKPYLLEQPLGHVVKL